MTRHAKAENSPLPVTLPTIETVGTFPYQHLTRVLESLQAERETMTISKEKPAA